VHNPVFSRRDFFGAVSALTTGVVLGADDPAAEPIIDIHQHTNYSGRTDEQLITHQRAMGVTTTVLLPAGKWYGLDALCGGNDTVVNLASRFPKQYYYFANEIPYLDTAKAEITNYLKRGAIGIGEQKFRVLSDSGHLHKICEVAKEFKVPILMHFQATDYNLEIDRFHRTLEKFPDVNFIGHAQTFWGNIDKNHKQEVMYPTGKVTPGGITDRLLSDHPNMYGDMSAGSGLNAIIRDEEHYRAFMERHQDKLMFGSDCNDTIGAGPGCQGAQILAAIRRVTPSNAIRRKIMFENAKKLLRI
jgi:uncharacterized protein